MEMEKVFQGNCYTLPDSLILEKGCDCHKRYFMVYIDYDKPILVEFCKNWYNMRFMEIAHEQGFVSSIGGERQYFHTDIHFSEKNFIVEYILWEFVFKKYGGWFPSCPMINKKANDLFSGIFSRYTRNKYSKSYSEYYHRDESWILAHTIDVKLCERPLVFTKIEAGDVLAEIMNGNECPKDIEDELVDVFLNKIPKTIFQKLGYKLRDLFYKLNAFHYKSNEEKQIILVELANALLFTQTKKIKI